MISRTLSVRPTDLRVASDLGRESMTYTMSHFTVELHLCGKTIPNHARACCSSLHGIQWHRQCRHQWKLLAPYIDILAGLGGTVVIFDLNVRDNGFTAKMPGCTALAQFKQEAS